MYNTDNTSNSYRGGFAMNVISTDKPFKRNYSVEQVPVGHPCYIENIPTWEISVSDENDNHWLFYCMPKADANMNDILHEVDNFSDEILDMLTNIWEEGIKRATRK